MEKLRTAVTSLTVEPLLTAYILPSVIIGLAAQNLKLELACQVNLGFSADECGNHTEEIQLMVISMNYWQSVIKSGIPAALVLFLGAVSDATRRRVPFMIAPMCGELAGAIGMLLCWQFGLPVQVAGVAEALLPALGGGSTVILMASFAYLGDVSRPENRTVRLALVNIVVSATSPVGILLGGFLLKHAGFYGVFITASFIYVLGILFATLVLRDVPRTEDVQDRTAVSPFRLILNTFAVAFKKREGNLRLRILITLILCFLIFGPLYGEIAVGYLFTRYKFKWDEVDFSFYSTYSIILNLIGTSLAIAVFTQWMKLNDALLGAIACTSKVVASCFYGFAPTSLVFYLATLIDFIGGTSGVAVRSLASKLVLPEELGKIYSLFGLCEAIVPIIYQPLYSAIYTKTITVLPGAFFLLGGLLTLPAVYSFLTLYYLHKKGMINTSKRHEKKTQEGVVNETFQSSESHL